MSQVPKLATPDLTTQQKTAVEKYVRSATTASVTGATTFVADRTALAALATSTPAAYLGESGREGIFVWSSANNAANVTSDPNQGVYVAPSSDTTGASGAWVRRYNGSDLNVKWFGAVGDGTTDDHGAFAAAVAFLGNPGGAIFVPHARYRQSATLVIPAGIRLYGGHAARNPGIIGSTSYPYPTFYTMGVLYFDAGVPGIELQPNTAATATSTGATTYDQAGATWVQIENLAILSAGGGTADTYGIKNRVVAYLTSVYVRGFLGHGVFTTALGGGSPYDDEIYGNADQSIYTNVHATSNGQHGFYTTGGDANVILFNSCNASANGGWGFYDHSLLGNTYVNCHTASNTLGSYKNTSAVGSSTYLGCYIEGTSLTDLSAPCAFYNGQGSSVSLHPAGSPAFIQGGSNSFGAPLTHFNNQGAVQVSFQMGVRGTNLAAWAWGDNSDTPTSGSYQMVLGKSGVNSWSDKWWNLIYAGSQQVMEFPRTAAAPRAYAPSFKNGIFLGPAGAGTRIFYMDSGPPTSGTWAKGDIVWEHNPTTNGPKVYMCLTAGTPGTWQSIYGMTGAIGSTYTAWTGTANRGTKDTSTATLADCAQTLKALIDDLKARGVIA
jgi:hypothetical protein